LERRLAAILAADVVGYSRLMGVNEAATLTALSAHRRELVDAKIAEHRGRIVKVTGDGLLVEFPSVVNAVTCAAEIQGKMRERNAGVPEGLRIEFRIGVNIGDVIVEGDDIFGDGVNVAARLEAIAKPGGIALSGTVRDHLGTRLDLAFEDIGEQVLKNIDRPVRVFRVALDAVSSDGPRIAQRSERNKPSIAVLPFTNMSADPEQEYFADGITEDLITDLSKASGLSVIARPADIGIPALLTLSGPSIVHTVEQLAQLLAMPASIPELLLNSIIHCYMLAASPVYGRQACAPGARGPAMNTATLLFRAALEFPDRSAITVGARSYATFGDLASRVAALAPALKAHTGARDGDRIAIFASNRPEYVEVLFACWWAGLVAVPINAKLHPKEVLHILSDSGALAVFTCAKHAHTLVPRIRVG
jgi:class 3 adenylate cyclase